MSFEERNYAFETIYNFRDFGGYKGLDGRAIKPGRLFRSAHLASLSDVELAKISALNIDLVVDLRHAPERKKQPSRLPHPEPSLLEYPDQVSGLSAKVAPHEAFLEHDLYTASDAQRYMIGSYTKRPHDPGFKAIFSDTLKFMARREGTSGAGVLIHCAAGKDRTGTLCALIQGLLGVSRDDIISDYMMTLDSVDIEAIIEPAAQIFSKRYGRQIDAKSLWPMFSVKPEFLEAALDNMGDLEKYAQAELEVGLDDLSRLRTVYLEH